MSSIPRDAVIQAANLTLTINGGEEDDDDCHDGDHEGAPITPTSPGHYHGAASYLGDGARLPSSVSADLDVR